jgi:hypothetical protein
VIWLVATLIAFGGVLFIALQLALGMNGGAGGHLMLGPILIAEASHSGGRVHGGVQLLPVLLVSALIGVLVAAGWVAIAGWRRRSV